MVLNEIRRNVARLEFENIDRNIEFVNEVGDLCHFVDLLNEILGDEEKLEEISGKSYRHVNHFDKIVLFDDDEPDHARLTLHLWRPPYTAKETSDELIHDHRFSFCSRVLCGNIKSEVFERAEIGACEAQKYNAFSYCPETRDLGNFYSFEGEVWLRRKEYMQTDQERAYFLSFDSIHRICLPQREAVATLVLRSPRLRNRSTVFNSVYPTTDVRLSNTFFSPEELAERLTFLKETINNNMAGRGGNMLIAPVKTFVQHAER